MSMGRWTNISPDGIARRHPWTSRLPRRTEGDPVPLDGRDHQPQLPGPLRRRATWWCGCRARTPSCSEIDRGAERDGERAGGRGSGSRRRWWRCSTTRPAWSPSSSSASRWTPEELREPAALDRGRRRRCGRCTAASERLPTELTRFRIVETYAATDRASAAPRSPPPTSEAPASGARGSRRRWSGPEHEPVPCHNDLLAANFIRGAERHLDRRLGVRRDGRPLLRPRQLRRQQRARRGRRGGAARAPTSRAPASARRLATLRLMRFMSDFREAMWGVVQSAISDLDFDFDDYASKHFDRMRETAADAGFEPLARGGRVAPRAELPDSRPLRDRRRRRRRHLDRLPPGEARLGRRRPARALAAHLGLDLPLAPGWSASCAARSR